MRKHLKKHLDRLVKVGNLKTVEPINIQTTLNKMFIAVFEIVGWSRD
jgi:hypothetical protein